MNLSNLEKQLKVLYLKKEMFEFKYKNESTIENRDNFYEISDTFNDKLSQYYSHRLFSLKIEKEDLFLTYLGLRKESVIKNWLNELIIKWNNN